MYDAGSTFCSYRRHHIVRLNNITMSVRYLYANDVVYDIYLVMHHICPAAVMYEWHGHHHFLSLLPHACFIVDLMQFGPQLVVGRGSDTSLLPRQLVCQLLDSCIKVDKMKELINYRLITTAGSWFKLPLSIGRLRMGVGVVVVVINACGDGHRCWGCVSGLMLH